MFKFDASMPFVLRWEGGSKCTKDPQDPGGTTKYGISQRHHPEVDVENLTEEQAKKIYFEEYWVKAECEKLPWPDCLVHLDTAVNLGVARATSLRLLSHNWNHYLFLRLEYYSAKVRDKGYKVKYLRGWMNRVIDLYRTCVNEVHPIASDYIGGKKPPG